MLDTLIAGILILFGIMSLVLAAYWIVAIATINRTRRLTPTARAGIALALRSPPTDSVAVIVPAHNEAGVIGTLVESLRNTNYPRSAFVLALDRCSDDTAAVARRAIEGDPRFTVIEISSCPEGWAGKTNAAHIGAQAAIASSPDVLLFADADTRFAPECIGASLALMADRKVDLLSLLSTLTCESWYERSAQAAAVFELLRQFPLLKANRADDPRPFANGQFMMFRREVYDRIGGHGAVRGALLEDLAFAKLVRDRGFRGGVVLADGLLVCKMYHSWGEFKRGWKRIFTEAATRRTDRLRGSAWFVRFFGAILPAMTLMALIVSLAGAFGAMPGVSRSEAIVLLLVGGLATALWLLGSAIFARESRMPMWIAPGMLVGSWLVADILARAARDLETGRPTSWGGREYTRTARPSKTSPH